MRTKVQNMLLKGYQSGAKPSSLAAPAATLHTNAANIIAEALEGLCAQVHPPPWAELFNRLGVVACEVGERIKGQSRELLRELNLHFHFVCEMGRGGGR